MARVGAVAGLEEELTCPICLGIYSTPVSLSCGHSFCRGCIQEARVQRRCSQGPFGCPLCGARTDPAAQLQPNVQLRSIVQKFLDDQEEEEERKRQRREMEEGSGQRDEVVLCDFCLQEPQPAVKTCLTCEASFCQAHLSKHSSKSSLKDHVLVESCDAQALAEMRCPQHGKVLECYCKTDLVCICMLCCITSSHKNHEVITLEEAFAQGQSALGKILETVKTEKAALDQIIANLEKQEKEVKTKESLRRTRLESLFEKMRLQLDDRKEEVLEVFRVNEAQQLSQIQTHIQKHKEEKDAACRDVQKLEALRNQKDQLLFTKAFATIPARKCTPVHYIADVQLPMPPIILDELTRDTTLRLFQQFLSHMQSVFNAPPVHEHLTLPVSGLNQSSNVVYAPTHSSFQHPRSYTSVPAFNFGIGSPPFSNPSGTQHMHFQSPFVAAGFRSTSATQHSESDQSFSEGCHFWEVDTSKATHWELGIIHGNVKCYLEKSQEYLHVFLGQIEITKKQSPAALTLVRVELDCGRNTLSFYNASVKTGGAAESLRLIERVSIPSKYPVRATFGTTDGSLKLL
ncbi:PREDICTED: probable E3 ubiquitin-protein ligase TRIM8 [Calidris pugnax]|uniref:probable E3 ubiquitin-protein ligase TRIM8 n=1 Tax=Calidris pugnax TaxID=198806 RepID=UPI00071D769F|nr:PREDICTED: probable E3 ubiquitin-protein ligase TRIM8 [Calidris pugnax]